MNSASGGSSSPKATPAAMPPKKPNDRDTSISSAGAHNHPTLGILCHLSLSRPAIIRPQEYPLRGIATRARGSDRQPAKDRARQMPQRGYHESGLAPMAARALRGITVGVATRRLLPLPVAAESIQLVQFSRD
jgi:hypothetical protein